MKANAKILFKLFFKGIIMGAFFMGVAVGVLSTFILLFGSLDTDQRIIDRGETLCQAANSTTKSVDWFEVTCENNAVIPLK